MKPALFLTILALASCATRSPEATAATVPATSAKKDTKKAPETKLYPLTTCLVTGDGLDDMDERVTTVYQGQTFEFCCKPCLKKFNKNPAKYVKALAKATS